MVLTDPRPACGHDLADVVRTCAAAGATAIQLRDKDADAHRLVATARTLRSITRQSGLLLIVNDRMDVALAAGADGVHLGPNDLPVSAARAIAPAGFLIGYSTDDDGLARAAADDGADYLGVGAVYGTRSKPDLADEAIGPARVAHVLRAAGLPGLGIGGITPDNAGAVFAAGAGVAVLSAVMGSIHPGRATREILATARRPVPGGG